MHGRAKAHAGLLYIKACARADNRGELGSGSAAVQFSFTAHGQELFLVCTFDLNVDGIGEVAGRAPHRRPLV